MVTALLLVAAFVLASVPTGVLVARAHGVDLRQVGSGNIGATNVGRALGKKWALVVLALDAVKGALPVLVFARLFADPWLPALGGMAAVLGHVFSIFLRGRGGKGVATSLGAGLALAPLPTLACVVVFVVVYAIGRIVSIGSLLAVVGYPLFLWLFGQVSQPRLGFGIAVGLLVVVRHRSNLGRLVRGEEHRG